MQNFKSNSVLQWQPVKKLEYRCDVDILSSQGHNTGCSVSK